MTIKLEQETILQVLERPPHLQQQHGDNDMPPPVSSSASSGMQADRLCFLELRKPLAPAGATHDLAVDDDDTLSTASLSSDEGSVDRRVSFCAEVVTEVWTRPFTEKDDIPNLFYSSEDTARFRQEYRLEKKLLSELSIDPETHSVDAKDLTSIVPTSPSSQAYKISRVVVLHNDKLETFVDQNKDAQVDGFFDNDSFWSGSITWF